MSHMLTPDVGVMPPLQDPSKVTGATIVPVLPHASVDLVEGDVIAAGRRVAARPEVTHCYQRPRLDAFPFDLYAMIHTGSWEETDALFRDISADCGLRGGELFASGREFKKSSMEYFR